MYDVVNVDEKLIGFANSIKEILRDFRDVIDSPAATNLRFDCRYDEENVFEACAIKTTKEANYREFEISLLFAMTDSGKKIIRRYDLVATLTDECKVIVSNKMDFYTTEDGPKEYKREFSEEETSFVLGRTSENFLFYVATNYILLKGANGFDVVEKWGKPKQGKSRQNRKKKKNNVVRLYKCYTLKREYEIPEPKQSHQIDCPAWGVRGHYRHYKSGKTVFVPQHVKGKDKTKYQGKEYVLFPRSEEE